MKPNCNQCLQSYCCPAGKDDDCPMKTIKERPILFSGPMVRAILEGRKTQTRRIAKPRCDDKTPCEHWSGVNTKELGVIMFRLCEHGGEGLDCPYGQPGDRLWVRETFRLSEPNDCACYEPCSCKSGLPIYKATCGFEREKGDPIWKPSIFMPRWASRITLEITGVRVERLQDITEADAKAEGVIGCVRQNSYPRGTDGQPSRAEYAILWESINGQGSWDKNPWVWVLEFKKL